MPSTVSVIRACVNHFAQVRRTKERPDGRPQESSGYSLTKIDSKLSTNARAWILIRLIRARCGTPCPYIDIANVLPPFHTPFHTFGRGFQVLSDAPMSPLLTSENHEPTRLLPVLTREKAERTVALQRA
jgi:hypothetical protein